MVSIEEMGFFETQSHDDDVDRGETIFSRASDTERMRILTELYKRTGDDDLNMAVAGAFVRMAWMAEHHLNGVRYGSFISALEHELVESDRDFSAEEFIDDWAEHMMEAHDLEVLGNLEFPITIYRGGLNDDGQLASGWSWTMSQTVAEFYANKWPARWGRAGEGEVVTMQVDHHDVAAYLGGRNEQEIVLADLYLGVDLASVIPLRAGVA